MLRWSAFISSMFSVKSLLVFIVPEVLPPSYLLVPKISHCTHFWLRPTISCKAHLYSFYLRPQTGTLCQPTVFHKQGSKFLILSLTLTLSFTSSFLRLPIAVSPHILRRLFTSLTSLTLSNRYSENSSLNLKFCVGFCNVNWNSYDKNEENLIFHFYL